MDQVSSLITLTVSDARPALTTLPEINAALTRYGARLWPIDFAAIPVRVVALFRQEALTAAECSAVLDHFLLPREELFRLIGKAGRKPQVASGGETETFDASNRVRYPQLYLVGAGIDYSRFDRFHVNAPPMAPVYAFIGLLLLSNAFTAALKKERAARIHHPAVVEENTVDKNTIQHLSPRRIPSSLVSI
jgi:hypothetical protein